MKANELRIGNWIKDDESKKTGQVTEISDMLIESTGGFDASFGEPIPLTPEWLERFGFGIPNHGHAMEKKGFYFYVGQFMGGNYYLEHPDSGHFVGQPINHVHQLQNLHFALTGEELTTNN